MDQCQESLSGSDGDSVTLEIERGDVMIADGCNERKYSPPAIHVTKVLISPKDRNQSTVEVKIFTNDLAPENGSSDIPHNKTNSPFGPFEERGASSQTHAVPKEYKELAEALSHLTVNGQGEKDSCQGSIPVSPALSTKFRNSIRSEAIPQSKNPFFADSNTLTTNSLFPIFLDSSSPAAVSTGTVDENPNKPAVTSLAPLTALDEIIDPPKAFRAPELLGKVPNATTVSTSVTCESGSSQDISMPVVTTVGGKPPEGSVRSSSNSGVSSSTSVNPSIPPDVTILSQNLIILPSEPAQEVPDFEATAQPMEVKILTATCSEELPLTQDSFCTRDQSQSSFHFPEPPKSAPLVCVPVKEVKFEEPPKHQVVTAIENVATKLGEIVPITVQPGHSTANVVKSSDEPNVVLMPTHSASRLQSKETDESGTSHSTSNQANVNTESKMNNLKHQEVEITADQADHEEHEHSYGIIGNEDNLSEITLPPLAEGNAHLRDHDVGPCNNGHPCHRIRISIDQQSATPSRRAMAITGVLVVLLISIIILLGVYKFVNKISSD